MLVGAAESLERRAEGHEPAAHQLPWRAAGDCAAAEVAGSCTLGAAAAVSLGLRLGRLTLGTLALGARLLMALLTPPPHPVTSRPAARAAARGTTSLGQRRGARPHGER